MTQNLFTLLSRARYIMGGGVFIFIQQQCELPFCFFVYKIIEKINHFAVLLRVIS